VVTKQQTTARISEEYLHLLEYVDEQVDGAVLEYRVVEDATGVAMDARGKAKLRNAIRHVRRECSNIRKVGYKLAEPEIVMGILAFRLSRIGSAVTKADKAHEILAARFFEALKPDEKKGILFIGSAFGAIRLATENAKKLYGQRVEARALQSGNVIPIPKR